MRVQYGLRDLLFMTNFAQKSLSFGLFAFGTLILATSLIAANKASTGDTSRLMGQKVYMGRTILPDHLLYPAVMIGDRIKLQMAPHEESILLQVEYSDRRYRYAAELLHKGQPQLAFTTLTKSQKYLLMASNEVLVDPSKVDKKTIMTVRDALDHSIYRLEKFKSDEANADASAIDQLILESKVLLQNITAALE
jgi:hypothetical protein